MLFKYVHFELFAVSNYEALMRLLRYIGPKFGAKGVAYVQNLNDAINNQLKAVESGDIRKIIETINKGADVTESGAEAVKKNPILYWIAKVFAPEELRELANAIKEQKAGAIDENKMMGVFYQLASKAAWKHFFVGSIKQINIEND